MCCIILHVNRKVHRWLKSADEKKIPPEQGGGTKNTEAIQRKSDDYIS